MRTLPICLAILLPASGQAQVAREPPAPQPGDRYAFETTYLGVPCADWRITSVDPRGEIEASCEGWRSYISATQDLNPTRVLKPDGSARWSYEPLFPLLDFPLQVGKAWKGKYEGFDGTFGVSWSSQITCSVEAYESGEHPQFRIRCDDAFNALLLIGGTATSLFWYSPELGRVTRQVHQLDADYSWRMLGW